MRLAARVAPLFLALWLCACATAPAPSASPEEQRAYDAARAEVARSPAKGRAALTKFLAAWPDAALADSARVQLGDLALAQGDAAAAQQSFDEVLRHAPKSREADAARVRLARLALSRGDARTARDTLERVRLAQLEPGDRRSALRALADSAEDDSQRVLWLAKLRAETRESAQTEAIDAQIEVALANLGEPELARLARELGDAPPAASVALARAERALDAGDVEAARAALKRAESLPATPGVAERLAAARERLQGRIAAAQQGAPVPDFAAAEAAGVPDTSGARGAIGVVLPLSGPYASFGEEGLRGVMLAAGVFGAPTQEGDAPLRIVVRDSQGQPAVAADAVRELASDPEVAAIVGPLVSAECEAAAAAAEELGVPLLTLTAREEVVRGRHWVFRLRTRPAEETELLAERARALGAQRFAILYRDDAYGRGLRSLFWDAVEAHGGRVVSVASYAPGTKDYAEPIRRLVGYLLLDDEEKALIAKREQIQQRARRLPPQEALALRNEAQALHRADGSPLPPVVDFDALFVPENADGVVLIAPHLAFQEVNGVRLLGPDGWYDKELVRLGGDHVEGALFVSHFFPDSPVAYVHDFTQRYRGTFGSEPAVFAAQSYDAARLALVQLAAGRASREKVRDGVLETAGFPGVAGVLSMDPDGNARKRPYLLQVVHGEIVQVQD